MEGAAEARSTTVGWFGAIRLVDYKPHYRIGAHAHSEASFSLIIGGRYLENIQGRNADHEAGHMIYCPANEEHAQVFAGDGALQAQISPTTGCLAYLQDTISLSTASFLAGHQFSSLGRRMALELHRGDAVSPLALEGLALEAITLFGRASVGHVRPPRWVTAVDEYVRAHAMDGFTVHDVAEAVGCPPEQIGPALRTAFGSSLAGLARRRRLEAAADLLAADEASISDVAALCGFSDQAHLTRRFKAVYGLTPGAFRRAKAVLQKRSIRR